MPSVADALRRHAPQVLSRLAASPHAVAIRKAFAAIMRCRTGELGGVHWCCTTCQRTHWVGRSCGNRHCPTCGHDKTQQWLQRQSQKLLPGVHHFLVTFTVPRELAVVLRAHRRAGYEALFAASSQSLLDVMARTKSLKGTQPGFFGVLHTWGRDPLVYHPHVHYVVAGGGVVLDDSGRPLEWKLTPANFLVHHGTLMRLYKTQLAEALRAAGLFDLVPAEVWTKPLVADIQPVDGGNSTLAYLAPYVHRVAISDQRIVAVDQDSVTYRYKPQKSRSVLTRTVSGREFVEGFAQHVLPTQFRKVRYYGWMASNSKAKLEELRMLVWFTLGWVYWLATAHARQTPVEPFPKVRCRSCGAAMRVVEVTNTPVTPTLASHALAYLDSG
jgi:hypothetical protein